MTGQDLGRRGEAAAARWYMNQGYTLLDHNYKSRQGELDLILRKDDLIVIVEVKSRSGAMWYRPMEAVNWPKQKRIILAAQRYLQVNRLQDAVIRFDVAEVIHRPEGGFLVRAIQNAFQT